MKAPGFWYKRPGLTAALLMPFSALYRIGSALRRATATPYRAKVPVICVGNLVAGGAGKTPVALALGTILKTQGAKPGFATRGYGGKLAGPLRVDPKTHNVHDVGDEALILARLAPTWVGKDRAEAIKMAEKECTHIILDDGLQNPTIRPNLALLVIDSDAGFGNGLVMPAGPLRETYDSAMERITAVILIGAGDEQRIASRATCPVLRAHIEADLPVDFPRQEKFFAFAGIGRPEKFYKTCKAAGLNIVGTRDFSDHHMFSDAELQKLTKEAAMLDAQLLTTEKDWMRLPLSMHGKVRVLPIKLVFDEVQALTRILSLQ